MPAPPSARSGSTILWVAAFLTLAAVTLWVLSIALQAKYVFSLPGSHRGQIAIDVGRISYTTWPVNPGATPRPTIWILGLQDRRMVRWGAGAGTDGGVSWVRLPLWMPVALFGVPTAWLWYRRRCFARTGRCSCGYDLRAIAIGGLCPECGAMKRGPLPQSVA